MVKINDFGAKDLRRSSMISSTYSWVLISSMMKLRSMTTDSIDCIRRPMLMVMPKLISYLITWFLGIKLDLFEGLLSQFISLNQLEHDRAIDVGSFLHVVWKNFSDRSRVTLKQMSQILLPSSIYWLTKSHSPSRSKTYSGGCIQNLVFSSQS